ncbi:MAG: 16S rRNA (guanine(527)-N(7))-methyltransferase RsmG [Actinobacteria bacterium]|nr:16S rRNA (guanine(527)-N(7))-methyltransferase RsmG [Actinomycetota bacterium]
MKHEGLIRQAADLGVALTPVQATALTRFESILQDRAAGSGMIARGDLDRLRTRHVLDSLRAVPALAATSGRAIDLGSGAGLPGIPVAIALPELRMTLTEARRQRIAFLEMVVVELGLTNVTVHGGRAERATGPVDACVARAFRDAASSWAVAETLLDHGGRLVYFAGAGFDPNRDLPSEVRATILPASSLAKSGPLVIMTRQ